MIIYVLFVFFNKYALIFYRIICVSLQRTGGLVIFYLYDVCFYLIDYATYTTWRATSHCMLIFIGVA
jgi:hypothetical protein